MELEEDNGSVSVNEDPDGGTEADVLGGSAKMTKGKQPAKREESSRVPAKKKKKSSTDQNETELIFLKMLENQQADIEREPSSKTKGNSRL